MIHIVLLKLVLLLIWIYLIYFGYSGKKGYNPSKPDYMYGAGAEIDGIFLNTKTVKMGEYAPPCDNCKITFNGFLMP